MGWTTPYVCLEISRDGEVRLMVKRILYGISQGLQSRPNEQTLFVGISVPQALEVGFAFAELGLETVVAREGAAELSRRRLSGHSGALLWESRCGGRRGCACRRLGACCRIRPKSRSDARLVGKECVSKCGTRGARVP